MDGTDAEELNAAAAAFAEAEALADIAAALDAEIDRELADVDEALDEARGPFTREAFERAMPLSLLAAKGDEGDETGSRVDMRYLAGLKRQADRLKRESHALAEEAVRARAGLAAHRERSETLRRLAQYHADLAARQREWGNETAAYWRERREQADRT